MYSVASLTVTISSASSSGISMPNSSSKAMTSSTMSRESAPRSSMNLASGVTSSASTPNCSTMIFFTLSSGAAVDMSSLSGPPGAPRRSHPQPAVDVQHLPREVSRLLRGQKADGPGHLLGPSEAPGGDLRQVATLQVGLQARRHVGLDEPGGHGVPPAPPRGHLQGHGF